MGKRDNVTVFKNKSLESLLEDIYKNSMRKTPVIEDAIRELRKYIDCKEDVVYIGPIIADYMDVGLKNDDNLIKLAKIVQRLIAAESKGTSAGGDFELSEQERKQLLDGVKGELQDLERNIAGVNIPEFPPKDKLKSLN